MAAQVGLECGLLVLVDEVGAAVELGKSLGSEGGLATLMTVRSCCCRGSRLRNHNLLAAQEVKRYSGTEERK